MLLVIDNEPLQATAWSELRTARQRLVKATRDLHRHEQIDAPGFRSWLGKTFPELVNALRELTQQIAAKSQIVDVVEHESWISGRSPRAVWRQWQREAAEPERDEPSPASHADPRAASTHDDMEDPCTDDSIPWDDGPDRRAFEKLFEEFCAMQGLDPHDPAAQAMRERAARMAGFNFSPGTNHAADNEARAIYRRLVQHLHPDRGGAWTPQRARVWHDVQAAWEARDTDMLARLEAEWEVAADTLSATSAVSRLRAALTELHAARRDAERKIRLYRKTPEWRFSLSPPSQRRCEELRRELTSQREFLRTDLSRLEALIAKWERRPAKRPRTRARVPQETAQPAWAYDDGR